MKNDEARLETPKEANARRATEVRTLARTQIPVSSDQLSYAFVKKTFITAVISAHAKPKED